MKLRISVEDRLYDVEVDVLNNSDGVNNSDGAKPVIAPTGTDVPDQVLRQRHAHRLPEDSVVRSPIAGRVAAILADPAQKIRRHQGVVLLEAMKMEVPIGPAVDGTLRAIHVAVGDAIATGQPLFDMAP
jgi:biotin carboxyl carrier protein